MFKLNDILTNIFGKNGRSILSGITLGKIVDEAIETLSPNVNEKSVQIRDILNRKFSRSAAIRL
jgi:hypothetical protein